MNSDLDWNNPNLTVIPQTASITADVHVAGDLLVAGRVTGSIEAAGFVKSAVR